MLLKMLRPVILMTLALAPYGIGQAADMKIDCRLKGGSVVQLPAEACGIEGGAPVNGAAPPAPPVAPAAAPASADGGDAKGQPSVDSRLAAAQKVIVDLLGKPVVDTTKLNRNPEGIERTARFDGCKLMVEEDLHVDLGNLFSARQDFKISSAIDFQKIDRKEFGMLGKINSKGGSLKAAAVYFEERKDGNNISISVLESRHGGLEKYRVHPAFPYWDAPKDDLWIADEYGYPKDDGVGGVSADKVRILFIVATLDEADRLKVALEDLHAACRTQ